MIVCLDTNIVIALLNNRPPQVRFRLQPEVRAISLPVVALFELRYGIAKSDRRAISARLLEAFLETTRARILPFEKEDASEAADIRATLERTGTPIGAYDVLIAAQARRRGATLVTANTREFSRMPGLKVEDWTTRA